MIALLLGAAAAVIALSGLTSKHAPVEQPADAVVLPAPALMGPVTGVVGQAVRIEPLSEQKFKHIVRQSYDYSCGSAALVTVLNNYVGTKVTERQAMEGMLAHGEADKIMARRGFSLLDMRRYLATLGIEGNGYRGGLSDLAAQPGPVIVPIDFAGFKHFVVVRGVRGGLVHVADPALGHTVLPAAEFLEVWDRRVMFVLSPRKNQPPLRLLALKEYELGVLDADLIRPEVVMPGVDTIQAIQRGAQSATPGSFTLRP